MCGRCHVGVSISVDVDVDVDAQETPVGFDKELELIDISVS
jgi:hypothetical protein